MTLGFFLIGINQIILSWLLIKDNNLLASVCLFLSGIGVCLVGLTTHEYSNGKFSKKHYLGAGMQFLFFSLGALVYSLSESSWNLSLPISIITIIFVPILFYYHKKYKYHKTSYFGLLQKLNVFLINIWLILSPLYLHPQ